MKNKEARSARRFHARTLLLAAIKGLSAKFKQGTVKDYRVKFSTATDMNHVEAQILDCVARLYPEIFQHLDSFRQTHANYLDRTIALFDREVQFYAAYLDYTSRFKRAGLKFCYPDICNPSQEVSGSEVFDLALAWNLVSEKSTVVCNDFYRKRQERIFIVSGPNQGGKTTFARTFGQIHYLASLGLTVPAGILDRSVEVLQTFMNALNDLRAIGREYASAFHSEGFGAFFALIEKELNDEYFAELRCHLKELKFHHGVLISAELGKGNKGVNYVLRKLSAHGQNWIDRIFAERPETYTFYIHPRDESGARAVSGLKDVAINLVSNALAQSTDHILSFFTMLRTELAFYIGCLNLQDRLTQKAESICFPTPLSAIGRKHSSIGLSDICLTVTSEKKIVSNDLNAGGKGLVIITGANQGGKSTFLRSIGLAQLLMQAGMFVPAVSFSANLCDGIFTHYKREEDAGMKSGKLDEELSRMSKIINAVRVNSLVLFNESFAATNEREGSEIATDIIRALLEKGIKMFFVTHSYELAHGFFERRIDAALFLRAERREDGDRTFKILQGAPLQTSFGEDLYKAVFAESAETASVSVA